MALGGSMPVMAETVPGRETVREETEAGQAESPESSQTGPQGQETAQPGAVPEAVSYTQLTLPTTSRV